MPVRLAPGDEVEGDSVVGRLAREAAPGRFVAFRAVRDLPADAEVTVALGAGTPSAEGSRRTAAAQVWTAQMRDAQPLSHDPDPADDLTVPWHMFAENVGTGHNVDTLCREGCADGRAARG